MEATETLSLAEAKTDDEHSSCHNDLDDLEFEFSDRHAKQIMTDYTTHKALKKAEKPPKAIKTGDEYKSDDFNDKVSMKLLNDIDT